MFCHGHIKKTSKKTVQKLNSEIITICILDVVEDNMYSSDLI